MGYRKGGIKMIDRGWDMGKEEKSMIDRPWETKKGGIWMTDRAWDTLCE